jgi:beta-glucanase (GH16 family)
MRAALVVLMLPVLCAGWVWLRGEPADSGEAVVDGSAGIGLGHWTADSDAGPVRLDRATLVNGPQGAATAIDLQRKTGTGSWAFALGGLDDPERFFEIGKSYRLTAWVRDLNASAQPVGILLANANYKHQPTTASRYGSFRDTSWHILTTTFVCTAEASADTSFHVALPATGPLHWQLTNASVQDVAATRPARVARQPSHLLSFRGPTGSPPDPATWNHEVGGHGWGNDEEQTYTDSTANASLDGQGHLVITARRENVTGPDGIPRRYTSARLTTEGKVLVQPGSYVEASIRPPVGTGAWAAFWLLGSNIDSVGWPACGELDVLEVLGSKPTVARTSVHTSLQSDPRRDAPYAGPAAKVDFGHPLDSRTHRYGVYFNHRSVRFYIDGKERMVRAVEDALASGRTWPFGQPMFIVLNVAVGGREDPSATALPKSMTVGSVQIWRGGTPF